MEHTTLSLLLCVALACIGAQAGPNRLGARSPSGTCPAKDGANPTYLTDEEDCSIFYECSAGEAVPKQCLPGLCFDPKLNVCAFPPQAEPSRAEPQCGGSPCSTTRRPTCHPTQPPHPTKPPCSDPNDPCSWGNSRCKEKKDTPVGRCPPRDHQCDEAHYLPAKEHCDVFYQCVHGRPVQMCCPDDLCFDPETNVCQ